MLKENVLFLTITSFAYRRVLCMNPVFETIHCVCIAASVEKEIQQRMYKASAALLFLFTEACKASTFHLFLNCILLAHFAFLASLALVGAVSSVVGVLLVCGLYDAAVGFVAQMLAQTLDDLGIGVSQAVPHHVPGPVNQKGAQVLTEPQRHSLGGDFQLGLLCQYR